MDRRFFLTPQSLGGDALKGMFFFLSIPLISFNKFFFLSLRDVELAFLLKLLLSSSICSSGDRFCTWLVFFISDIDVILDMVAILIFDEIGVMLTD